MLAAIPASHDNQMVAQPLALQHTDNNHASATFAIVAFDSAALYQVSCPAIMRCFRIGTVALEL
jgi:hypothetical protein